MEFGFTFQARRAAGQIMDVVRYSRRIIMIKTGCSISLVVCLTLATVAGELEAGKAQKPSAVPASVFLRRAASLQRVLDG